MLHLDPLEAVAPHRVVVELDPRRMATVGHLGLFHRDVVGFLDRGVEQEPPLRQVARLEVAEPHRLRVGEGRHGEDGEPREDRSMETSWHGSIEPHPGPEVNARPHCVVSTDLAATDGEVSRESPPVVLEAAFQPTPVTTNR